MEQKPHKPPEDLFPKAEAAEEGIRMVTWGGFEVVLPYNLVTPDKDYAQNAPNDDGMARPRRSRSRDEEYNVGLGGLAGAEEAAGAIGDPTQAIGGFAEALAGSLVDYTKISYNETPSLASAIANIAATVASVLLMNRLR